MKAIAKLIKNEPVGFQAVIQMGLAMVVAYGVPIDVKQMAATLAFSAAVLAFFTRKAVTPVAKQGGGGSGSAGGGSGRRPSSDSVRFAAYPLLLAGAFACALGTLCCKSGGGAPFKWPDVVRCAGDVGNLVGVVTQTLVSDIGDGHISPEGKDKLSQLAQQYGADTVLCLVRRLINDWSSPAATKSDEREKTLARARDFIAQTKTLVQETE